MERKTLMRVKDIMRSPAITIREHATLREAVTSLRNHRISGMPVLDSNEDLVGIVTERDIIGALMPTYKDIISTDANVHENALLDNRTAEMRRSPISEIMNKQVFTLDEDDSILKAASMMLMRRVKILPVTAGSKVIGIVARIDILSSLIQDES
ncbi:MAG TPA: CBS domain-containing protein [Armatimonadota bacterium]|jgi:CBS domain-containing protein